MRRLAMFACLFPLCLTGCLGDGTWIIKLYSDPDHVVQFAETEVPILGGTSITPGTIPLFSLDQFCPDAAVDFDVQVSSATPPTENAWRFLLFRVNPDSNCQGLQIAQASGTGLGNATFASGEGELFYTHPSTGQVGSDFYWTAEKK